MPKRADNPPAIGRRNFLKSASLVGAALLGIGTAVIFVGLREPTGRRPVAEPGSESEAAPTAA